MLGIQAGFVGLLLLSHMGVGALLLAMPFAMTLLRWGCFGYLLWLALVIFRDARRETAAAKARAVVPRAGRRFCAPVPTPLPGQPASQKDARARCAALSGVLCGRLLLLARC
jgi:arginine exporter protein ArgO